MARQCFCQWTFFFGSKLQESLNGQWLLPMKQLFFWPRKRNLSWMIPFQNVFFLRRLRWPSKLRQTLLMASEMKCLGTTTIKKPHRPRLGSNQWSRTERQAQCLSSRCKCATSTSLITDQKCSLSLTIVPCQLSAQKYFRQFCLKFLVRILCQI